MCERMVRSMLHQLAHGLAHVHLAQMVHLDIKPANIFLSFIDPALATEPTPSQLLPHGEVVLKIGDFGLAAVLDERRKKNEDDSGGDGRYVCPALMNQRCKDLRRADVFSLAATVYAVALGSTLSDEDMFRNAIREGNGYSKSHISAEVEKIIVSMLSKRAEQRPQIPTVIEQLERIFEADGRPHGYPITIQDFDRNDVGSSNDSG
eukprot:TRINITY_DN13349_c0_g2_i1.p1 TRINITY_DN13349_c0_g2~~TRINITY_DN13349_c0_g2_i1.p1  ORF type:complete len:206 (-),score=41.78 TRINITY_DN13349_c0_g2_i1:198-815(-)